MGDRLRVTVSNISGIPLGTEGVVESMRSDGKPVVNWDNGHKTDGLHLSFIARGDVAVVGTQTTDEPEPTDFISVARSDNTSNATAGSEWRQDSTGRWQKQSAVERDAATKIQAVARGRISRQTLRDTRD